MHFLWIAFIRSISREYGWADYKPVERTTAAINKKLYDAYAEQYQLEISPDYVVVVSVEAGKLMMEIKQPVGQIKVRIFPELEIRFLRMGVDVQITFVKNERGQVTALIVHQQGAEFRVKKIEYAIRSYTVNCRHKKNLCGVYLMNT